jgi:hypothetical protein
LTPAPPHVDRGVAVEAEVNEEKPERGSAGPLPLYSVDVTRDRHYVVIAGGERSRWEATAGHWITRNKPYVVYLNGREAFESPEADDPNRSGAQIAREATEAA